MFLCPHMRRRRRGGVRQGLVNGTAVSLKGTGSWPACLQHCHDFLLSLWPCLSPDSYPLKPKPVAPSAVPTLLRPCRAVGGGPLFVDPLSDAFFATSNYQNVVKILGSASRPDPHARDAHPSQDRVHDRARTPRAHTLLRQTPRHTRDAALIQSDARGCMPPA